MIVRHFPERQNVDVLNEVSGMLKDGLKLRERPERRRFMSISLNLELL